MGNAIAGSNNICLGNSAGLGATNSNFSNNICIGQSSGTRFTTGSNNICIGTSAGTNITTGAGTVAIGQLAGTSTTQGNCVFIGYTAGNTHTTGGSCVAVGAGTIVGTTNAGGTAVGYSASTGGFTNSSAFGINATCTSANQIMLGTASETTNTLGGLINGKTLSTSTSTAPSLITHLGYTFTQATTGWTTSISANTQTNITSIAFTGSANYGTYLFNAMVMISATDTTSARQCIVGINTTTANYGTYIDMNYIQSFGYPMMKVSRVLNIYADTTVYLVGYVLGSAGTVQTTGSNGIFTYTRIA